jgi:hypothetical protein
MPAVSKRKFYKHIYQLTIISTEPLDKDMNQEAVYDLCHDDCEYVSGLNQLRVEEIDAVRAIREMKEFHGEPHWFGLSEKGQDLDPE